MDWDFMQAYGPGFLRKWGHAGRWPVWPQLIAAERGRRGTWLASVAEHRTGMRAAVKTPHKLRKRDLCQCEKPRPQITGGCGYVKAALVCRHCHLEVGT